MIEKRNKKGLSVVVGYVLLIVFVVFLGVVVYNWMKTYVPQDDLNCPEGTSLFIKDYNCTTNSQLNLTLKNNGKFNVGGYFIRVTNTSGVGLATIDLSKNITSGEDFLAPTGVKFGGAENSLPPNYDATHVFNISDYTNIYSVEIVPIRWQEEARRKRLVSCKTSIIRENLICT
jgi:hypothetical protein